MKLSYLGMVSFWSVVSEKVRLNWSLCLPVSFRWFNSFAFNIWGFAHYSISIKFEVFCHFIPLIFFSNAFLIQVIFIIKTLFLFSLIFTLPFLGLSVSPHEVLWLSGTGLFSFPPHPLSPAGSPPSDLRLFALR